jgi:ribosomal protein S12 methylthiotransferase accessory factor YcaO
VNIAAGAGSLALGAVSDLFAKAKLAGHGVTLALCDAGGTAPAICAAAKADGLQLAMTVFSAGYVICGVMFLRVATFMIEEYKTQA